MSENWQQCDINIVIIDKLQSRLAKYLSYYGLLHYSFIIQYAGERSF